MGDSKYFENFAMFIPHGPALNSDGTPVMYVDPDDKIKFIGYCEKEGIDLESKNIHEREQLFKGWKNKK